MTLSTSDKLRYFEESGEHFIDLLERTEPHRTITARHLIRKNLMKVRNDLQTTSNAHFRPDHAGIRRASQIAFGNRIDSTGRIRAWLKNAALNTGAGVFVFMVVMSALSVMGGS